VSNASLHSGQCIAASVRAAVGDCIGATSPTTRNSMRRPWATSLAARSDRLTRVRVNTPVLPSPGGIDIMNLDLRRAGAALSAWVTQEPSADDLRPSLRGWNPYCPDRW